MPWSMAQGEEMAGFAGAAWVGGALTLTSLFRRLSRETDGAAMARRHAIDGRGDIERAARAAVEVAVLVGDAGASAKAMSLGLVLNYMLSTTRKLAWGIQLFQRIAAGK